MKSKHVRIVLIAKRNRQLLSEANCEFVGVMLSKKLSEPLTASESKSLDNMTSQLVAIGALRKCQKQLSVK